MTERGIEPEEKYLLQKITFKGTTYQVICKYIGHKIGFWSVTPFDTAEGCLRCNGVVRFHHS